ncbi:MAG: glutamate 5-kinase [gamma proteobacterium symbiont of Bathyaustriella thionipta]|nr:glutamate 5-kinase [gamma proteobacterium symbiont of Bathyaustriella thionipta]
MFDRSDISSGKRWVIKIGSALLTNDGRGLDHAALVGWVEQMAQLCEMGHQLVLVSSGAVAEGLNRMGWKQRPQALHDLQAAAAIGQMGLIQAYESSFRQYGLQAAQILLTHDDLSNRQRYLNARNTLRSLLALNVLPVVNENDSVATDELRFGDNDTLAALVANLVEADLLVLLTDQDGLFNADPRSHSQAELISRKAVSAVELDRMAGGSKGGLGRGGMQTKLQAARLAARSGTPTVIAGGKQAAILTRIQAGEAIGTLLCPDQAPDAARKQWLAGHLKVAGRLTLDDGAVQVLLQSGRSLLAVGVTAVSGSFRRGEVVVCVSPAGVEVARGLVNYDAEQVARIMGRPSRDFQQILGYIDDEELIHRDSLVICNRARI